MSLLRPPTQGPTPPPRRVLPPVAAALPSSAHQAICLSLACPSLLSPRRGDEGARPVSSATSANATTVASGDEFPMNFVPFRAFFLANFGESPERELRLNGFLRSSPELRESPANATSRSGAEARIPNGAPVSSVPAVLR